MSVTLHLLPLKVTLVVVQSKLCVTSETPCVLESKQSQQSLLLLGNSKDGKRHRSLSSLSTPELLSDSQRGLEILS